VPPVGIPDGGWCRSGPAARARCSRHVHFEPRDETALDLAFGAFPAHESVELAEREVDGISIALYWLRGSDVLAVTVDDATTGDRFELVVAEKERPLDVFYHPFAYAHARGIELFGDRHLAGVAVDV
jgi:hypothetical protein